MLFTFLITIVFIAELVISIAILVGLIKLMQKTQGLNELVTEAKPKIKDISVLCKGISEQFIEFAENFVSKFNKKSEDIALNYLTKILGMFLLWKINSKTINKFRKSKLSKLLGKGLSLLESMV